MSLQAMVWAFGVRDIKPSEKLLLMVLGNYANEDWQCWPGQQTLANDCNMHPRSITSNLARLEALNLISRTTRLRADGSRTTDLFTLESADFSIAGRPETPIITTPRNRVPNKAKKSGGHEPSTEPSNEPLDADASLPAAPPPLPPARLIFNAYNEFATEHGKAKAAKLTEDRAKAIRARLRDYTVGEIIEAISTIPLSEFLMGRTAQGFPISLDFVLQASSLTKLIEGFYHGRRTTHAPGDRRAADHASRNAAMFAGAEIALSRPRQQ